jgi:LmbE family N-acetylglucosaminyl deacetylase
MLKNRWPARTMQRLSFLCKPEKIKQVICLGAHCDDIEIGTGGTILRLVRENPGAEFLWIVFSSTPDRAREARRGASLFLAGCRKKTVLVETFRDGFFPYEGRRIKQFFEQLKAHYAPNLVFTHYRNDRHQDHRVLSDLTWNTFRDHLILEYEIPKYDGDLGSPNCFVPLDAFTARRKMRYLMAAYGTQKREKHWFDEETFRGLMRLRGIESNAPGRYAEAFYGRKLML